jgi:hypothetical protein
MVVAVSRDLHAGLADWKSGAVATSRDGREHSRYCGDRRTVRLAAASMGCETVDLSSVSNALSSPVASVTLHT